MEQPPTFAQKAEEPVGAPKEGEGTSKDAQDKKEDSTVEAASSTLKKDEQTETQKEGGPMEKATSGIFDKIRKSMHSKKSSELHTGITIKLKISGRYML